MQLENTAMRVFDDLQQANEDTNFSIKRAAQNAFERPTYQKNTVSFGAIIGDPCKDPKPRPEQAPPKVKLGTVHETGYNVKLPEDTFVEHLLQRIANIRPAICYLAEGKAIEYTRKSEDLERLERARLISVIQEEAIHGKLMFREISALETQASTEQSEVGDLQDNLTQLQDRIMKTEAGKRGRERQVEDKKKQFQSFLDLEGSMEKELKRIGENCKGSTDDASFEIDVLQTRFNSQETKLKLAENMLENLTAQNKVVDNIESLRGETKQAETQLAQVGALVEKEEQIHEEKLAKLDDMRQQNNAKTCELRVRTIQVQSETRVLLESNGKLLEELLTLKGTIRVFVRVRKPLKAGETCVLQFPESDDRTYLVSVPKIQQRWNRAETNLKVFKFDQVFGPTASNRDVFKEVSALTESAINGKKVCIFAYGQTGSGKTYTMSNRRSAEHPENEGVITQAFSLLFAKKRESIDLNIKVSGQFVEIYLNSSNDFFKDDHWEHVVDKSSQTAQVAQPGARVLQFKSQGMLENVFHRALRRRHTAATNCNRDSSRSHMLLYLYVQTKNLKTGKETMGVLSFVDLAGSERVRKSGAVDMQLNEAITINTSLVELGTAIRQLGEKREVYAGSSELVKRLRSSLCGARILMIAAVAPGEKDVDETIECLRFATEANKVRTA